MLNGFLFLFCMFGVLFYCCHTAAKLLNESIDYSVLAFYCLCYYCCILLLLLLLLASRFRASFVHFSVSTMLSHLENRFAFCAICMYLHTSNKTESNAYGSLAILHDRMENRMLCFVVGMCAWNSNVWSTKTIKKTSFFCVQTTNCKAYTYSRYLYIVYVYK